MASNFFKHTTAVVPEPPTPAAIAALAKLFSQASGGIVADADPLWGEVFKAVRQHAFSFGFQAVELAPIEEAAVYERMMQAGLPSTASLVWQNKSFFLRASALAGLLKVYASMSATKSPNFNKWYTISPALLTTPKGALYTDWQLALGALGDISVILEAQLTCALWLMCTALGLEPRLQLDVNCLGGSETQKSYSALLSQYLQPRKYNLCDACAEHLASSPMEIMRCSNLECQAQLSEGPVILDSLDAESQKRFTQYLENLEELSIPYQLSPSYAGKRHATGTCFALRIRGENSSEVFAEGSTSTDLAVAVTGKPYSGFVADASLSRLRTALGQRIVKQCFEVYMVPLGDLAVRKSLRLMRDLVASGVTVHDYFGATGVKNQLKLASDAQGRIALIMGQREAVDEMVILRDIVGGIQETFHFEQVVEEVKKRLGR